MLSRILRGSGLTLTALLLVPVSTTVFAAEGRQIEEVVVTAERRESTVQDTAISITAFTGDFIEDFGLRNQEDLQNYLPATTIQPYDLSVRGVGRLYRALGGDPGIATYFDGAYSEDFGIASTEGGLFDIERIEVLRGPQGTLYGRNGLGGAVNFHSKKPTDEFEGEIKTIYGSFETKEMYGMFSGPLIEGVLNARVTGVKRTRDGFVEEFGPTGKDLNNYGDENYTLALEWMPTEKITVYVRGNERSYARMMSGAQGAGAIIVSEMGGMPDPVTGGKRWTSMPQLGWREVQDPNIAGGPTMCANAVDRSVSNCTIPIGLVPYINGTSQGSIAGTGVYRFNHNGMERFAQPIVGGVDARIGTSEAYNWSYQANGNQSLIDIMNRTTVGDGRSLPDDLDGDDLVTYTNGFNDEYFDHQAVYASVTWDLTDRLTLKYIGGYTDYFYDRTTDHDRTGLPHDTQFFAAQENENFQHELQMFLDIGDDITLTGGLFMYENDIDQQLDFYHTDGYAKFTDPESTGGNYYNGLGPEAWGLSSTMFNHRSAKAAAFDSSGIAAGPCGAFVERCGFALGGAWLGDNFGTTGRTDGGPRSDGTMFIWDTVNQTSAKAVYLQGEWQMNETWALTLGLRWAEDEKVGQENLFIYQEISPNGCLAVATVLDAAGDESTAPADVLASGLGHAACGNPALVDLTDPVVQANVLAGSLTLDDISDRNFTLAEYNQFVTGAIDATGNIVDFDTLRVAGVPTSTGLYRQFEKTYDDVTWRVNVDYSPTDDDLVYFSVTTGYRAGGFNLGYFAPTPVYDNESITAYELGYKGQMFDGTLQINASLFYYDYEDISLQFLESGIAGEGTSVTNAPGAENYGGEVEVLWLATDSLTVGFNYSHSNAKYDGEPSVEKQVVDTSDASAPSDLYTSEERKVLIDGEPLPRVPFNKATVWGEFVQSLGDNGRMTYLTTVAWTDEFPAAGRPLPDGPLVTAPDFLRWDARISWKSASEQWNVAAYVNNILDDIGTRNMFTYGARDGYRRAIEPTNPRWWGIELQYKFGAYR